MRIEISKIDKQSILKYFQCKFKLNKKNIMREIVMKCIVIGAGNAGRPAARILNHTGNKVILTDKKLIEEFPAAVQKTLKIMEKEGIELLYGF